jgi:methylated-DNA-[protein]-cysteine S-methyltransferase
MNRQTCSYSEDEVLAYVAGDLAGDAAQAMAEHLGECEGCRQQAAEFAALGSALPAACAAEVVRWHSFATPFGTMNVAATDAGLARVSWQVPREEFLRELAERFPGRPVVRDAAALAEVERQLTEYFAGARSEFELPVDLSFLSEFERRVLGAARRIRFGEVTHYSDLARRIGRPRASRAVGNALGRNPVAIVVPCHRVIRRDGSLGGYGGGIEYKERLLTIEGRADLLKAS